MLVHAPAKLNLCLYLGARRADGLHELCSVFEPLALADAIEVGEADADEVVCPGVEGENLAARALAALREAGWESPPLRIEIEKRVPVAAGLGGGSGDAAAVSLRPAIAEALRALREAGAPVAVLSGSGPTAVGLFPDAASARAAAARLGREDAIVCAAGAAP